MNKQNVVKINKMSGQKQTNQSLDQDIQNLEATIQQLESEIRNIDNT